ncbi:unnamed protein product [Closterium sp. Yama58-4]|nr:unnamed protein product [Closterium sp. Yama58-4]
MCSAGHHQSLTWRSSCYPDDDEEEDAAPQQTRKFAVPEEIPAAPQGLFGLVKLPFAGLIRGRPADRKTVFVAGATGLTGARVVVELLSAGLSVRAGVEDLSDAQQLAELAAKYKVITGEEAKRLNFVEYSASDSEFTAKSIANAGTVVVTLGAGENGPSGNLEIDEALSLARAAILANAPAFVLVSDFAAAPAGVAVKDKKSGGGGGGGLIAAILNFFRSLAGKKGESASYSAVLTELVEADSLEYTVLRVGKFEADSSAYRTNLVVGEEGSIAAGSLARVQVAQVIAAIAANPGLAANKVVDLVASADAEAADIAELLAEVPEDPRRAKKKEAAERAAAEEQEKQLRLLASAEAEAAAEEARRAAESAAALEAQAKALAAEEARAAAAAAKAAARAQAASTAVSSIESNLKEAGASIPPPSAKPAAAAAAAPAAAFSAPSLPSFAPSRAEREHQGAQPEPAHSLAPMRELERREPGSFQDSVRHSGHCASPQLASPGNPRETAASRSAHRSRDRALPTSHRGPRGAPSDTTTRGDGEENRAPNAQPHCPLRHRASETPRDAARRDVPAQLQGPPGGQGRGRRPPLSPAWGPRRLPGQPGQSAAPQATAAQREPARRSREQRGEGLAGELAPAGLEPGTAQQRQEEPGGAGEQQRQLEQQQELETGQSRSQRCDLGPPLTSPIQSPSRRTRRQQAIEDARTRRDGGIGSIGIPQLAAASARARGGRGGGRGRGRSTREGGPENAF